MPKSIWEFVSSLSPSILRFFRQTAERHVRRIMKQLMIVFVASTISLTGCVFISIGVVEALSTIVARWAAYSIVGLALALIGLLLLVIGLMTR